MASHVDCECEEIAISRSQTPLPPAPLVDNVLQPEKDFILTFETLTELWDTTNPHYTNKYKRNENLEKLLPILRKIKPNATLEDVKKKINTIRSNYRRELKKITLSKRSGAATEEIYTPKIWYFPYLHFLRRIEQPVPLQNSESIHQVQQHTATDTEQASQQRGQQTREDTQEKTFSSISSVSKPLVSSTTKKKKINHNELLNRACQYLSEPCTNTNQQTNLSNPIALEWSNTLDRLDPIQRLYAKKAINDILFEAELGNLNRNSVRINDPPSFPHEMTCNTTQNFSPYSYWSSPSPNNSTLTSPPPPPSPAPQQIVITQTPPISQQTNPQQTVPVTRPILSQYSSSNTSSLTSPPPPSPAPQKIVVTQTIPTISQQTNPQQTLPVTRPILSQYSSSNISSLASPPPTPAPISQQIISSNHHYDHQSPISHSTEYVLHIPENSTQSSTNYQDIHSLFSQLK